MARPVTQTEYVSFDSFRRIKAFCIDNGIKLRYFHARYCPDISEHTFYRALRHEAVTQKAQREIEQAMRSLGLDKGEDQ